MSYTTGDLDLISNFPLNSLLDARSITDTNPVTRVSVYDTVLNVALS